MVERSVFDQYLASVSVQAGALLFENEECTGIERSSSSVFVRTDRRTLSAPVVIGADGYFSRVRKLFQPRFDQDETRYCVLSRIPLPAREINGRFDDCITIHHGFVPEGYAWIFPKGSHISVGAGGALSHSRTLANRFREFLALNHLDSSTALRGCFIPVSRWRRDIYTDRILLVGDAAGLVDSFNGEGIRFAVASGRLAAETVIAAHHRGDFTIRTLREYQERCWDYMGQDLENSNRATDLVFKYPNLIFGTLIRNDEALKQYVRSIAGEISFSDFLRWIRGRLPRYLIRRYLFPI
jgi:flavin-dependent dehydrogenase